MHGEGISTKSLEEDVVKFLSACQKDKLQKDKRQKQKFPLLFVIDEAHALLRESSLTPSPSEKKMWIFKDSKRQPYQIFRRTFRIFKFLWRLLWLVIISTSGKVRNFLADVLLDPSRKIVNSPDLFPPFVIPHTYRCKLELPKGVPVGKIIAESVFPYEFSSKIDLDYICSLGRLDDLFSVGRPFVKDCLDHNFESIEEERSFEMYTEKDIFHSSDLKLLFSKICTGGKVTWKEASFELNTNIYFSILGFSVGLSSFPSFINVEDLVEKNLMTLIEISDNGRNHVASFLPEGPLNAVASWYLCKFWDEFKRPIRLMVKFGICDTGDFGELVARIILLCCAFFTADSQLEWDSESESSEEEKSSEEDSPTEGGKSSDEDLMDRKLSKMKISEGNSDQRGEISSKIVLPE